MRGLYITPAAAPLGPQVTSACGDGDAAFTGGL